MNLKRMVYATSIAAGIGLAGLSGAEIATANAAPVPSSAQQGASGTQPAPKVKLDHHDRKEALKQDKKELKKPQQVTPAASSHH